MTQDTQQKNDSSISMEDKAALSMQKARSELLFSHPFFGSLALKLKLKADKNCPNLWTDGKTLAYNPYFISTLRPEHIIAAQAHEILHIACNHHLRRNGRDEKLWNKACDFAIAGLMQEAGFSLPESMQSYDKNYHNMSVDAIYIFLSKIDDEHETRGGTEMALTAEKTNKVDNASAGDGNNLEQGQKKIKNKNKKNSASEQGQGDDQVKAGTSPNNTEHGQGNKNSNSDFFGEIKDHPQLDNEKNKKQAEQDSLVQISQAMHSAQGHGDVPLGLLRLYHDLIRPKLDWQVLLQRFLENCNDGDYSWSMPNRRYISQDIYLPSRKEPRIPTMALAIDASGSVDNNLLATFCTELENILESYDTDLFIMYHDVRVQRHDHYTRADRPLRLSVQGGGGTSYKNIPEYLEQENIQPACLLWFTDFECNLFPEEPNYPVLWISTKHLEKIPPFGEVIQLDN